MAGIAMATGILTEIFGPDGLIVIAVVVVVLLFGGSRLPRLARGLGSASHEFKKGIAEGETGGAVTKSLDGHSDSRTNRITRAGSVASTNQPCSSTRSGERRVGCGPAFVDPDAVARSEGTDHLA